MRESYKGTVIPQRISLAKRRVAWIFKNDLRCHSRQKELNRYIRYSQRKDLSISLLCKIFQKKREMRKMMMKNKRRKKRKKKRKRKILKKVKLHREINIIISITMAMMTAEIAVKMKIVMKQETHEETPVVAVQTSKRKRTTNKQLKILKRRKNLKRSSPSPSSNLQLKSPRSIISASTRWN